MALMPHDHRSFPEPLSASTSLLAERMCELQREYRTASFLVGEQGVIPDGCPDVTVGLWRLAFSEHVKRLAP